MDSLAISIKDAARVLGVGKTKLYDLARQGRLKLVKIDRRSLITTESIQRLFQEVSAASSQPADEKLAP